MKTRSNKTASALLAGFQAATTAEPPTPQERPRNGNWSRQAARGTEERIEDALAQAANANASVRDGIIEGTIPVRIPATSIIDDVGSDRIASPEDIEGEEGAFDSLVANIRARGLRTPLRVRPLDTDWRPDKSFPTDVSGQRFALQSGRRRLAACQKLGIMPLCFITFPDNGQTRLDDLQERFFENTVRKDLTAFERLYSIGLIAAEMEGMAQAEIAQIIGVPRASISRGLSVLELRDQLVETIDLTRASRDQIDAAISKIRDRTLSTTRHAVAQRTRRAAGSSTLPFRSQDTPLGKIRLRAKSDGMRVLTIESADLDDERLEKLIKAIHKL